MNMRLFIQTYKRELFFWIFTCLLVCFPFLFVRYVPITDLPQHLCQIRLFIDYCSQQQLTQGYSLNWSGANSLVYLLLGFDWFLFSPIAAGKALMLELALAWVASIFFIAHRNKRPVEVAVLAGLLVFNALFYWGFINFLIGFPIFLLWQTYVVEIQSEPMLSKTEDHHTSPAMTKHRDRNQLLSLRKNSATKHSRQKTSLKSPDPDRHEPEQSSRALIIKIIVLSVLLFLAHALWLAAGALYLLVEDIRRRRTVRQMVLHGIALLPIFTYSLVWYLGFSTARASSAPDTGAHWVINTPFERLHPQWLINALTGGLDGPLEIIVVAGILVWIVLVLLTNREQLRGAVHGGFLWAGVFFTVIVFFAPMQYMNTIGFASRWMPIAVTFFLLSLPMPKMPVIYRSGIPLLLAIALFGTTGFRWHEFETKENTGLTDALDAIPDYASVLGLDYVKSSTILRGRPYMQTFAYAQAVHSSKINFSFAEHQNGIIRTNNRSTQSAYLEWYAEHVQGEDFARFDYALINAPPQFHAIFSSLQILKPVTTQGQWRLYRCDHSVAQRKGPLFAPK